MVQSDFFCVFVLDVVRFFCGFGFAFMSTSIACSKLNGKSDTGFAFGMRPPWANGVAHSSLGISSEHASAVACSAFCYDIGKNVWILPVVVAIRKLRQVQRQVVFADLMEGAHHATLQQAPEGFDVVRMNVPAHVFFLGMIHDLVREGPSKALIPAMFIRRHERDALPHCLSHKLRHRHTVSGFDHFADHIALASNRADHGNFSTRPWNMFPLVRMAVKVSATDKGFINLHFPHQLRKASVFHRRTNAMAHIPGGLIGSASDDSLDLQGADALLALQHQVDHLKPRLERVVRVLKNCLADDRKAIAVPTATRLGFADPMKWASLQGIHFVIVAARTLYTGWPAPFLQKLFAGFFGGEAIHRLSQGHFGFHDGLRDVEAIVHKR